MPPTPESEGEIRPSNQVIRRTATRVERRLRARNGSEARGIGLGDAARILSGDEYAHAREELLEAAAQHRRAVGGGAERLVEIVGIDKKKPEVRVRWLPLSVADAMRAEVAPNDGAVRAIAACTLGGAREMLEFRDRAHGAIESGNVYLDTGGEEPRVRLGLCAPSRLVEDSGSASRDVHEVGRLLFELINRATYSELGAWPLADGPAWHALGPHGAAWRELCNDLLNPNPSDRPTAAEALERLGAIEHAPERRKRGLGPWIAAVAAVLVLGGGAALVFGPTDTGDEITVSTEFDRSAQAQWSELCDKTEAWFLRLTEELPGVSPIDDHIRDNVLGAIERARAAGVALDPRTIASRTDRVNRRAMAESGAVPSEAQTVEGIARTAEALRIVRAVEEALSTESWPALRTVRETASVWNDRGWTDAARSLDSRADAAAPVEGAAVAEGIAGLVAARGRVAVVEQAWSTLEVAFASAESSNDPLLGRFEAFAQGQAARARGSTALAERLSDLERLALELSDVAANRLPRLDAELLQADLPVYEIAEPDAEAFETWLAAIQDDVYERLDPDVDPHPAAALAERQEALAARLAAAPDAGVSADDQELASLRARSADLGSRIEEAAAEPWNRRSRAEVQETARALGTVLAQLERSASDLEQAAQMDPEAFIASLRDEDSIAEPASGVIDSAWRERRDAAIDAFEANGDKLSLQRTIAAARADLATLNELAPAPTLPDERPARMDDGAWRASLAAARERAIADTLAGDGAAMAQYAQLVAGGEAVLADLSEAERLLVAFYPPDSPGDAGISATEHVDRARSSGAFDAFGAERACAPLLALHAGVLAASASDDSGSLLSGAGDDAERFAAWRTLGDGDMTPALLAESTRQAEAIAAGVPAGARRSALEEEVRRTTIGRWAALCRGASDAESLDEALAAGATLGLGHPDAPDAATAFNAALHAFASTFDASADDEQAREAAQGLLETLGAGPGDELVESVRALLDPSRNAGPSRDPATLGPGSAGWALIDAAEDNSRVVYGFPPRSPSATLAFTAVFPEGGAPVYLAEQELSVATLNAIVGAMRFWDELSAPSRWIELSEQRSGAGAAAAWTGARSWRWAGSQLGRNLSWVFRHPTMSRDESGVIPLTTPDVDSDLNTGPRIGHPVQWMSPAAATLFLETIGCEAPSTAVWLAALGSERAAEGGSDRPGPNLRDTAWAAQLAYTTARRGEGRQAEWPDGGVYDNTGAPRRAAAVAGDTTDGVVWFTETDTGPGVTFKNLVGNVAEFVSTDGGLGVLGASALSPWGEDGASEVRPVNAGQSTGWADVGLRPSFEATDVRFQRPLAAEIAALVSPPPYVLGGDQ